MALAMQWVARIFAVSLLMILPGLGGQWLDVRFGTGFLAIVGFALGLVCGMAYLIAATRAEEASEKAEQEHSNDTRTDE